MISPARRGHTHCAALAWGALTVGAVLGVGLATADSPAVLGAQAAEGKANYAAHCETCHGAGLGGSQHAPALIGAGFRSHWDGKPARAVYSRIISTMPQDNPGSLTETEALTIALYVFAANGVSFGEPSIPNAAALNSIIIPTRAPE